jgi:hypothetical protein
VKAMTWFSESAKELDATLYKRLLDSEKGELNNDEILDIICSKTEFGFRKVEGAGITLVRARDDVEELRDRNGRPYLKLKIQ